LDDIVWADFLNYSEFIAYVAITNNMIDLGNMKAQFVDPYVTPDIVNTVQTFISVTMDAIRNFNMKV
jgi:hypothetical protein